MTTRTHAIRCMPDGAGGAGGGGVPSEALLARLEVLKADLMAQGRRVQALVEAALDTAFTLDIQAATRAIAADEEVDRIDVEIEKAAVAILAEACRTGNALLPEHVRSLLTIVKVNNELERIADVAVDIAAAVPALQSAAQSSSLVAPLPPTFRVLTNSVIGVIRDVNLSMQRRDAALAKVLMSESAIGEFRRALGRDVQQQLSVGKMPLAVASNLSDIAMHCLSMADHCTNIAEQVIYVATGTIVRHMEGRWEEVRLPG